MLCRGAIMDATTLRIRPSLRAWLALFLACSFLVGCGGSSPTREPIERSNLKPLAVLYGKFIARNRGIPPANEAEFKKYVETDGRDTIADLGVTNLEGLFVSPRDQKPYVVLYGDPSNRANGELIAYEQEGVEGTRLVVDSLAIVREVNEEQFRQLVPVEP